MSNRMLDMRRVPTHVTAALVRHFDAGRSMTAREVADRYEVSLRSAQRWLVALEGVVPLEVACQQAFGPGQPWVWRKVRA